MISSRKSIPKSPPAPNLAGLVEAVNDGGVIQLRSLDQNSNATITVNSGTNDALATLGLFRWGYRQRQHGTAVLTDDLNDLLQTCHQLCRWG